MTMERTTKELAQSAIRLPSDANGNPRYYFPKFVWPQMNNETRLKAGLNLYRGKQYGAGYVMQSYSLESDIEHALKTLGVRG